VTWIGETTTGSGGCLAAPAPDARTLTVCQPPASISSFSGDLPGHHEILTKGSRPSLVGKSIQSSWEARTARALARDGGNRQIT